MRVGNRVKIIVGEGDEKVVYEGTITDCGRDSIEVGRRHNFNNAEISWENCPPGRCHMKPPPDPKGHHLWRCSHTEDADVCSQCGAYRRPCRHKRR